MMLYMKDSEETATALKLAITRERSFSLLIHESKSKRTWLEAAVSFRRIAPLSMQLQLEQTDRHAHTHTHTHAQSYSSCGYASRHNYSWLHVCCTAIFCQ